ncbi:hypothetical protein JCM11251_001773 [Rhodosporidiobolus azoricus]
MAAQKTTTSATEQTPLLSKPDDVPTTRSSYPRLLITTFLLSTAFTLTASTLLYAFREILCDVWYGEEGHKWDGPPGSDRCALPALEAWTAREISFMVTLTTFSGILNLITTGWVSKRYGVRQALVWQTAWPVLRVACQAWAVVHGGLAGIRILQWTQLITIAGGGAGYMLTANTYCAALVEPAERTAAFGRLQGVQFFGTATGLMLGGILGSFRPVYPFFAAFVLLSLSTVLSGCFLPYIPLAAPTENVKSGSSSWLAPVKVFLPRTVYKVDGTKAGRWYGLSFLVVGAFLSVLATGFVSMLLQLLGTNRYAFKAAANGYLMALAAFSRAGFLSLLFPRIIAAGRRWYATAPSPVPSAPSTEPCIPTTAAEIEPLEPAFQSDAAFEPPPIPSPTSESTGSHFDLLFLRLSILLDGILTAAIPLLTSEGWHLYVAAGVLPLASGTAPAAKGVVMEMVEEGEQADALQGIALSETLALMLSVAGYGLVFSKLSELGRSHHTFYINAANALLAFLVLVFVRFPPFKRPTSIPPA